MTSSNKNYIDDLIIQREQYKKELRCIDEQKENLNNTINDIQREIAKKCDHKMITDSRYNYGHEHTVYVCSKCGLTNYDISNYKYK